MTLVVCSGLQGKYLLMISLLSQVAHESSFAARSIRSAWRRGQTPRWSEDCDIGVERVDSVNEPIDLSGVTGDANVMCKGGEEEADV